jgi:hypothetical protein
LPRRPQAGRAAIEGLAHAGDEGVKEGDTDDDRSDDFTHLGCRLLSLSLPALSVQQHAVTLTAR